LYSRFTTRRKLFAPLALVLSLLCGAAEPLYSNPHDQFAVSVQRDLVAPRPLASVSLGGPTKLKAGTSFRKNRTQALAPDESVGTTLQSSSLLSVACNVTYLAAVVTLGSGRSPPSFSLTI
jgi:hypothetical protein